MPGLLDQVDKMIHGYLLVRIPPEVILTELILKNLGMSAPCGTNREPSLLSCLTYLTLKRVA